MLPIRGTVHHADADDLEQEAIQRTLDGKRKWDSAGSTTMFQHLLGAMSSIADEWYKEMKRYSEFSDVHASQDTAHAQTMRRMALESVKRRLKGDAVALAVFESVLKDEKPSEAIARLKMPMRGSSQRMSEIVR